MSVTVQHEREKTLRLIEQVISADISDWLTDMLLGALIDAFEEPPTRQEFKHLIRATLWLINNTNK